MRYLLTELGYDHVRSSHSLRDVILLFASRLVRMFAFGLVSAILVLHLRLLDFSDQSVGLFLSLTLLGDVLLSLVVTWTADSLGRRRVLALGAVLMGASGLIFHYSGSFNLLLMAAVIGIVSRILSQLVKPESRVYVLMWYQFLGFVGTALGSSTTGLLINSLTKSGSSLLTAYRAVFILYTAAAIVKVALSLALTVYTEVDHPPIPDVSQVARSASNLTDTEHQPLLGDRATPAPVEADPQIAQEAIPKPRLPLVRLVILALLFSIDSFASSLTPNAFTAYYLRLAFNASLTSITTTFSAGALIVAFSQLLAGSVARRLGIILTMVGTHIPAQIFTISLAFAPTLQWALTFFLLRCTVASMDSAVRGAFLSAIIPKESRTRFLGIINVCKTLASAPGPTLSGYLAKSGPSSLRWSFVLCGGLKIMYDIGLLIGFQTYKMEH